MWQLITVCVTVLWCLMATKIDTCPTVRTPVSRPFKKTAGVGKRSHPKCLPSAQREVKQGEPAAFKTWEECIGRKRMVTSKHYKGPVLQMSVQVKKKRKKSDKNTSQLLCRTFQTLSCRLRLPHLPEGSASQKFVQGICIHILHRTKRKKKKQAVSRKFLPVLDIQLCRTATLLKQSGCLNLLIRFTHGLHDTGAGTGCFH